MEKTTLTVTQLHLGAPLQWEPVVGTAEHDRRVDAYIPGAGTLQAKRATIACDFFQTVEATSMPYPFTRTYHVSIPVMTSPLPAFSMDSFSSNISTPSSVAGSKRPRDSASPSAASSAPSKRLPGFSIMTKDGVDITDNQSRGPKTKEQRDHAAKMRKMGACPSCKRRKQKCDPSHQRSGESSATAPLMTASNSRNSSVPSLTGPVSTRSSISPQSSIQSAFTPPSAISFGQSAKPMSFESLGGSGISPSAMFDEFNLSGDAGLFDLENPSLQGLDEDWSLGQPPLGQDFDLFSYDNTFDFDASLYVDNLAPTYQQQAQIYTPQQQSHEAFSWSLDANYPSTSDVGSEAVGAAGVDRGRMKYLGKAQHDTTSLQNRAMNCGTEQISESGIATQQWQLSDDGVDFGINANALSMPYSPTDTRYRDQNRSDSSGGNSSISSPLSYVESAGTACTSPLSEASVALAGRSSQGSVVHPDSSEYHHPGGVNAALDLPSSGSTEDGQKSSSRRSRLGTSVANTGMIARPEESRTSSSSSTMSSQPSVNAPTLPVAADLPRHITQSPTMSSSQPVAIVQSHQAMPVTPSQPQVTAPSTGSALGHHWLEGPRQPAVTRQERTGYRSTSEQESSALASYSSTVSAPSSALSDSDYRSRAAISFQVAVFAALADAAAGLIKAVTAARSAKQEEGSCGLAAGNIDQMSSLMTRLSVC